MHENYLFIGKCKVMIDEFAVGGAEFIGFVRKQYRTTHNGRALPVIRKTKGDIFNGNVEDVFGFMFAYISVSVMILVTMAILVWYVFLTPSSVANTEERQASFESYTVEKTVIRLSASDDRIYSVRTVGSRTGVEPNCPSTMHFRIFRRAFTRKISILLRKITPKSIKNAFAGGCEQF